MKPFRPMILFAAILLMVGLACNAVTGGGNNAPSQPEQPQAPAPQQDEPSADESAPAQSSSNGMYFTEEFDQDPAWDYFLTAGDEDQITVTFEDSLMKFDLEEVEIYAYYIYEGQEYEDVRIDMRAENRGKNNNNVSLICRASDEGWYEFSTEGGGLWYLYAVTINEEKKAVYHRLQNGGTLALKQGKEVNEYGMTCEGREISLTINGDDFMTFEDKKYDLRSGFVGFNISSLNVTPIIVEVDWFKISEP
jgi:hypothetical protein